MIEIPVNVPAKAKTDAERKSDAKRRETLVKRIVSDFARGLQSVALYSRGSNGISSEDARAIGRLFVEKAYFASLVYDVSGRFDRLVVSKTKHIATADPKPSAPRKASGATDAEEIESDPPAEDGDEPAESSVEPDIFDFNGESVIAASDPSKPYALYRRSYPHKPKWIVADASHRVICLCLWRSHAQAAVDELNSLAPKK